ncbi:hypothetical protein H072_9517 [Dactylellina haptotyla CBS 200.50]|uniref:Uncharacterized protein n=1 Tax=Dactylellina haptotyla (strain CBS 200.50) TaxID=1284197 RepID=S8A2K0_DACHA|nr:hypothetical protein H072_9517 [Dactylellina haptotyla CBS 200.50]
MALNGLYPTSDFAEDQPMPHFILTTHVVHRTLPFGAFISSVIPLSSRFIFRRAAAQTLPVSTMLLRSNSTGFFVSGIIGLGITFGRMMGRDDIEWQDRSWRLLRNSGQTQLDDFSASGMALGAIVGTVQRGSLPLWRGFAGGAGLGSLAGTIAFVTWKMSSSKKEGK